MTSHFHIVDSEDGGEEANLRERVEEQRLQCGESDEGMLVRRSSAPRFAH